MRKRAELLVHIQNTNSQYNLAPFGARISKPHERRQLLEHFPAGPVRQSMAVNVGLIDYYDSVLPKLEDQIERSAQGHDPIALALLRSVPGIGHILALVILYEIERIERFGRAQDFLSYCRLVKPMKESAGKVYGHSGKKIGNVHLKWAFSEAAVIFLRGNQDGQALVKRLEKRFGKPKALSILAAKLARAVYFMLKRKEGFDRERFFASS